MPLGWATWRSGPFPLQVPNRNLQRCLTFHFAKWPRIRGPKCLRSGPLVAGPCSRRFSCPFMLAALAAVERSSTFAERRFRHRAEGPKVLQGVLSGCLRARLVGKKSGIGGTEGVVRPREGACTPGGVLPRQKFVLLCSELFVCEDSSLFKLCKFGEFISN